MRVIAGAHNLVQLFTWANANDLIGQIRRHGTREVDDLYRRNFGHKDLTAMHALKTLQHKIDSLLKGDPKTSHRHVGDRQVIATICDLFPEKGHHRASRTDYVAVAHHRKSCPMSASDVI